MKWQKTKIMENEQVFVYTCADFIQINQLTNIKFHKPWDLHTSNFIHKWSIVSPTRMEASYSIQINMRLAISTVSNVYVISKFHTLSSIRQKKLCTLFHHQSLTLYLQDLIINWLRGRSILLTRLTKSNPSM